MEAITDVAPATVEATLARYGIDTLIHGHTHRPKMHEHPAGRRIVLGDWYEQGSVLRVDGIEPRLASLQVEVHRESDGDRHHPMGVRPGKPPSS
jgi:UDP-2,3-diacylglucosamine hydrolase